MGSAYKESFVGAKIFKPKINPFPLDCVYFIMKQNARMRAHLRYLEANGLSSVKGVGSQMSQAAVRVGR